ncbi:uncharacterized protein [Pagrus major]|uniref:uncharacterized protein n=1 Tax=Pagrus major TaxID=143350 RepID=UPI003CC89387
MVWLGTEDPGEESIVGEPSTAGGHVNMWPQGGTATGTAQPGQTEEPTPRLWRWPWCSATPIPPGQDSPRGSTPTGGSNYSQHLINTTNSFTSQSSNYTDEEHVSYSSVRATDGNKTLCANTNDELNPWWRIDLLGVYNISCISIYNINQHNTDMSGARIHIGNSRENNGTNNTICTEMTNFTVEQWNNYTCTKQVSGRYVTVFLPGTKPLILCEVKIYGKEKDSPFQLIEQKKTWEHAIEYCRENYMDLATILDEDDQTLAELKARNAGTPYVWLGLHYTCILEVWFWVADYRLEFNRWALGEKTGDCDRSAVMSKDEDHRWFSKSDYDKFHFILFVSLADAPPTCCCQSSCTPAHLQLIH